MTGGQLVYFHPGWVFRDGADRMGETGAANYARRSNFPMINILRTNQVPILSPCDYTLARAAGYFGACCAAGLCQRERVY